MRRGALMDQVVDVVGALPELADALGPQEFAAARPPLRARVMSIRRGRWHADQDARIVQDGIGFLILDGALLHCTTIAHRTAGELLGPGDLLTWAGDAEPETQFGGYWRALEEVRVAILDARFARSAAAYPELPPLLVDSQVRRAGTLSRQLVIVQSQSVEARVVVLLEHLAERWGFVTPEGVVLPSFLSHGALSLLLGARRPSVTSAVVRLGERGVLQRRSDGRWLLPAPGAVPALVAA